MSEIQKDLHAIIQPEGGELSAGERLRASTMFNQLVLGLHVEHYGKGTETYSDATGGGTSLYLESQYPDGSGVEAFVRSESDGEGDVDFSRIHLQFTPTYGHQSELVFNLSDGRDVEVSWTDLVEAYHGQPGPISVRGLAKKIRQLRGTKEPESFGFRAASPRDIMALEHLMKGVSINSTYSEEDKDAKEQSL